MTDVQIQALIDNCKSASGDPTKVDWVDLANVLTQILSQQTLTDIPGAAGQVIKHNGTTWAAGIDATTGGTLTYPSTLTATDGSSYPLTIQYDGSAPTNPAKVLKINMDTAFDPNVTPGDPTDTVDWNIGFTRYGGGGAANGNTVMFMGYNVTPSGSMEDTSKSSFYLAWEQDYVIAGYGLCWEYHTVGVTSGGVERRHMSILSSKSQQKSYGYFTLSRFFMQTDNEDYPLRGFFDINQNGQLILGVPENYDTVDAKGFAGSLSFAIRNGWVMLDYETPALGGRRAVMTVVNQRFFDFGSLGGSASGDCCPIMKVREYATNAAAISAGLIGGAVYHTGGALKIVI
jgi:hypothetical protein